MEQQPNKTKDRLKEITANIERGIQALFESEKYQQYLRTMSRFHSYSLNNTLLISLQRPDATLKMRCAAKIAECEAWQKKSKADLEKATAEMDELKGEVFRVIRGESNLPQSVLSEMLRVSEEKVSVATAVYREACESARNVEAMTEQMTKQLGQLQSWSSLYDGAEMPVKKMIASEIIQRVTVSSDYKLDIQFNISYEQFMGLTEKNG